jgi:hypothetical protein
MLVDTDHQVWIHSYNTVACSSQLSAAVSHDGAARLEFGVSGHIVDPSDPPWMVSSLA